MKHLLFSLLFSVSLYSQVEQWQVNGLLDSLSSKPTRSEMQSAIDDSIATILLYADSTFVVNLVASSESPEVVTLMGVNADGKTLFSRDIPVGGVNISELQQQVNDNTVRISNAEQHIQFFQQFAFPSIDENIQNILAEIEDIKARIDSAIGGSVDSLVLPVTNLVAVSDNDSAIVKVSWTNPTYTNTSLTALDTIIIQVRIAGVTPFIQFTTLTPGTTSSTTLSGGVITGGETVQVRVLRRRNNKTSIDNPVSQEIVVFDTSSVLTYIAPVLAASAYQSPPGMASISWTQQGLVPPFYKLEMSINGGAYDSIAFYIGSQSNAVNINTGASSGDIVRFRLQPMDADTQEVNNISNIATITIPFPLTQPDSIIYYHTIYLNQSGGNDNFDGLSSSSAVRTFTRAQQIATDTSRILIVGDYTGYINITKSGTASKPLKIVSDRSSVITARNEARLSIRLSGDYIWVDSVYIKGWSGLPTTSASPNTYPQGISIIGSNCIVSNSIVEGESDGIWDATGSSQTQTVGIFIQGLNATVRDNEIYYWGRLIQIQPVVIEPCSITVTRNKLHDTRPIGYNDGDCIKIASSSGDTHGLVISHNEMYGWSNDGVDGRGQGITVEYNEFHNPQNTMNTAIALKRGTGIPEQSKDGVVRYNIVRDCNVTNQLFAGGSAITVSSSNTYCYYNLVYNISGVHGIKVDGVIGDGGNVDGINIFNNTVSDINMLNGTGGYGFRMENGAANHSNVILINNIFDGDVADVYFGGNGTLRNNLLVNNKLTIRSGYTVTQSNNISGSPGFVSSTDFTLTQTSPAIDAGYDLSSLIPTVDILGNAVPFNNAYDIGAYEYGAGVVSSAPTVLTVAASNVQSTTARLNVIVNPNNETTTIKFYWEEIGVDVPDSATVTSSATGNTPLSYSYDLTGLGVSTGYRFWTSAVNSEGWTYGDTLTFTTLTVSSVIDTLIVTAYADGRYGLDGGNFDSTSIVFYLNYNQSLRGAYFMFDVSAVDWAGKTILSAIPEWRVAVTRSDMFKVEISANDTIDPALPVSSNDLIARAKTTARVTYEKTNSDSWSAGSAKTMPDISTILQERIDKDGNNFDKLLLLIEGQDPSTGHQDGRSLENSNNPKSITIPIIYEYTP